MGKSCQPQPQVTCSFRQTITMSKNLSLQMIFNDFIMLKTKNAKYAKKDSPQFPSPATTVINSFSVYSSRIFYTHSLVICPFQVWNQPFFLGSLEVFHGKWHFKSIIWALRMFIPIGLIFVSRIFHLTELENNCFILKEKSYYEFY